MPRLIPFLLLLLLPACMGQRLGGGSASPPPLDADALRRTLHARINAVRRTRDLPPLAYDADLERLAQRHSRNMGRRGFFSHVNPRGEDVNDRARHLDLSCRKRLGNGRVAVGFGENLFYSSRYASYRESPREGRTYNWLRTPEIARRAVRTWMKSTDHRANLLEPLFEAEGLGVAVSPDGLRVYVTQVLC